MIARVEKVRALIAVGIGGTGTVLTTDSPWLMSDIESCDGGDDVDTLDISFEVPNAGLYLWEGTVREVNSGSHDTAYEGASEYTGNIRAVTPEELPALLAMEPPEADPIVWRCSSCQHEFRESEEIGLGRCPKCGRELDDDEDKKP